MPLTLGLLTGDLAQYLSFSTADLNTVDNNNRTAVSLAAERGDCAALQALLKHRADVNISSSSGSSPLHFAACATNSTCIKPLLDAGATIDALTNWEQTPLIYAAAYAKDSECAEVLLDAGAQINHRDREGITALGWTAITNNLPIAHLLIQRNADLTNVDHNGDTFLSTCATLNRVELLGLLKGRRVDVSDMTAPKAAKRSLLSLTAEHASVETVNALEQISLEGVDVRIGGDGRSWGRVIEAA